MNEPKDSHTLRPLPPTKNSHEYSSVVENPLDESSDISDDPTNTPNELSPGIVSPPLF